MDNGVDLLARQRPTILHLHENGCRRRGGRAGKHGFLRDRKMNTGRHKTVDFTDGSRQLDFLALLQPNVLH